MQLMEEVVWVYVVIDIKVGCVFSFGYEDVEGSKMFFEIVDYCLGVEVGQFMVFVDIEWEDL